MQDLYNFICAHYETIISVVLTIISVVVFILRKKPLNDVSTNLYKWCIEAINSVESSNIDGSSHKLNTAIRLVRYAFERYYIGYNFSNYEKIAESYIESILSTPQKKGEK